MHQKLFFIFICLLLNACTETPKIHSLLNPSQEFIVEEGNTLPIEDVNFLFVIDSSGSMSNFQDSLISNLPIFLSVLEEFPYYNYSFKVVSMEPTSYRASSSGPASYNSSYKPSFSSAGPFHHENFNSCGFEDSKHTEQFVKSSQDSTIGHYFYFTKEHFNKFDFKKIKCIIETALKQPGATSTSGEEYYFSFLDSMISSSLSRGVQEFKEHFFSDRSLSVIIFISDAVGDDKIPLINAKTDADSIKKSFQAYAQQHLDDLLTYKNNNTHLIKVYGAIPALGDEGNNKIDTRGLRQQGVELPWHALSLIEQTGGKAFSIFTKNWGKNLQVIAQDLKVALRYEYFHLKEVPDPSTIEVFFNDHLIPQGSNGWNYDVEQVAISITNFNPLLYYEKGASNQLIIRYHPINQNILREK